MTDLIQNTLIVKYARDSLLSVEKRDLELELEIELERAPYVEIVFNDIFVVYFSAG